MRQEKFPVGRHTKEVQYCTVQLRYGPTIAQKEKQADQVDDDKYRNVYDDQLGYHVPPAEFSFSIVPD